MKIDDIVKKCHFFYKMAISHASELKIDPSGMRDESIELVRKQRESDIKMRPIEIEIYPNENPFLADGRHRLSVAKERGDKKIDAIVRYYDEEGNVIKKDKIVLTI
jgi:hypothetical protein